MEYNDKSRSQKKRESTGMQQLGEQLVALSRDVIAGFTLPKGLAQAIEDWRHFPGHEAKRRQMQFIGRLMREADPADIERQINTHLAPSRQEQHLLHLAEDEREALLAAHSGATLEEALHSFAARFPQADIKQLRHLVTAAHQERVNKKPPKVYRELFRYLRALFTGPA